MMRIYYDGHCQICLRTASFLRRIDIFKQLQLISFRSLINYSEAMENEIHVYHKSSLYIGFDAFITIARKLPILWFTLPGLYLLKWLRLGDYFYKKIARARNRFLKSACDNQCFTKQS